MYKWCVARTASTREILDALGGKEKTYQPIGTVQMEKGKTMSDLISRQAAIDALEREKTYCTAYKEGYTKTDVFQKYNMGLADGIKALNKIPSTDAVEVVRCKDCKWWDQIDNGSYGYCHACKHAFYSSNWEIGIYRRYKEDWFCAEGERKETADDNI